MRLGQVGHTRAAAPVNATRGAQKSETSTAPSSTPEFSIEDEAPASVPRLEPETLSQRFPGIAEGLTAGYLWLHEPAPTRVPALHLALAPGLEDCSDFVHLEKRFQESLTTGLPPTPASQSLLRLVRRVDLLQAFPRAGEWDDSELRLSKLQEFLVLAGLPPLGEHIYEIEETLQGRDAFFNALEKYAHSFFTSSYLCRKVGQAKATLTHLWGNNFRDLKLRLRTERAERSNAGYEWVQGEARLTLCLDPESAADPGGLEELLTPSVFGGQQLLKRGCLDLVSMIHEYSHAFMDNVWGLPVAADPGTVGRALSEGFAVLSELLSLDLLVASGQDSPTYLGRRRQRVEWLQEPLARPGLEERMPYLEGVELFAQVFRESGLLGVLNFLKQLDPNVCNQMSRGHEKYQSAIPDVAGITALVSRK